VIGLQQFDGLLNALRVLVVVRVILDAGHLDNLLDGEMLADQLALDAEDILCKPGHFLLLRLDANVGKLRLEVLRPEGFACFRVAPNNVADASNFVNLSFDVLTGLTEFLQRLDDHIEREPVDDVV